MLLIRKFYLFMKKFSLFPKFFTRPYLYTTNFIEFPTFYLHLIYFFRSFLILYLLRLSFCTRQLSPTLLYPKKQFFYIVPPSWISLSAKSYPPTNPSPLSQILSSLFHHTATLPQKLHSHKITCITQITSPIHFTFCLISLLQIHSALPQALFRAIQSRL